MFTNTLFTTQTMADVTRADAEFQTNWQRLIAERALDAALADSFPASDPPSWTSGIARLRQAASPAPPTGPSR